MNSHAHTTDTTKTTFNADAPLIHETDYALEIRHPHWTQLRNDYIKRNPYCAACGYTKDLQAHHVLPVSMYPEYELEYWNLITLGVNCPSGNHHYLFGHAHDWKVFVPDVRLLASATLAAIRRPQRTRFQ